VIVNMAASPFQVGKAAVRTDLLARQARRSGAAIVYVNQVGGNDELIFDGMSCVVGPDGELKHGKVDEQKFGQRADTHGIMFALTRQMIINDDMGAFTDIPRQIGMGAAESIADAVWGLWLLNRLQADGKAFFSTDHKNYLEGADTTLTVDGLTAAEVLFGEQVKPNGRPLGIQAKLLLVPTALKVPAELLMKSLQLNETTTANKAKP
jgi:phage major head subunit gpT-like protein